MIKHFLVTGMGRDYDDMAVQIGFSTTNLERAIEEVRSALEGLTRVQITIDMEDE